MQLAKVLLVGISAFALGTGATLAADTAKSDPGFNKLDANKDGYLSRTEYLAVMTKKDLSTAKEKVAGSKDKDRNASAGSSKQK